MKLTTDIKDLTASEPKINQKTFPKGNPVITVNGIEYRVCAIDEMAMSDLLEEKNVDQWRQYGVCDMCGFQEHCGDTEDDYPCMPFISEKMVAEGTEAILRLNKSMSLIF